MSKKGLEKHLKNFEKEEIIELLLNLYDARKEAKDYFEFFLRPDEDKFHQKAREIIKKEFYPQRNGKPKIRVSRCKKAIKEFQTLGVDPMLVGDLMIYYIECCCKVGMPWKRNNLTFCNGIISYFSGAMDYLLEHHIEERFNRRIKETLDVAKRYPQIYEQMHDIYDFDKLI